MAQREVPKRFEDARLSDWDDQPNVKGFIEAYLENFFDYYDQGIGPILMGKSGTGKTHAAATIYNTINKHSTHTLTTSWHSASKSLNFLLDFKDLRSNTIFDSVLSRLMQDDLIVLDDISTIRNYERIMEYLWIVLDHRYSEQKPTIITANFDTFGYDDIWESIANWYTPAIARRLRENADQFVLLF